MDKYAEAIDQISLIELAGCPVRGEIDSDTGGVRRKMGGSGVTMEGEARGGGDDDHNRDGAPESRNNSQVVSSDDKRKAIDDDKGKGHAGGNKRDEGEEQAGQSGCAKKQSNTTREQRGCAGTLPTPQHQPQELAAMEAARYVQPRYLNDVRRVVA